MSARSMQGKTMFLGVVVSMVVSCSSSTSPQNDASTDAAQEAAATCTTPGAACPGGGKCFFPVGDCTATVGVCADDSACAGASTESVCGCDGTQPVVPQCGPGNYALAKASHYGPCTTDAGSD